MEAAIKSVIEVEEYLAAQPAHVLELLEQVRTTISKAAPDAEEVISYGMPGFRLNGMLVWYAAAKKHIGFYPRGSSAIDAFQKELAGYKTSKGAIQFPIDKPMPLSLITKIVKYRVKQNNEETELKKVKVKTTKKG